MLATSSQRCRPPPTPLLSSPSPQPPPSPPPPPPRHSLRTVWWGGGGECRCVGMHLSTRSWTRAVTKIPPPDLGWLLHSIIRSPCTEPASPWRRRRLRCPRFLGRKVTGSSNIIIITRRDVYGIMMLNYVTYRLVENSGRARLKIGMK